MPIQADDIGDLMKAAQKDLGRMKWTDLTSDLQEFIVLPQLFQKERVMFDSGPGHQWQLAMDSNGQARNVGLYQNDNYDNKDVIVQASIPWRHSTTNYSIDRREIAMNSAGPGRIFQLVKLKRFTALVDLAKLVENDFWGKPADSTDKLKPFGIDFWDVANATLGFTGGNPSGFTAGAANVSSTTYPRWSNFAGEYAALTKDDGIAKWKEAATKTLFMSPVPSSDYNRGDRYGYYMNYATLAALERVAENQNDRLGTDLDSMNGVTTFRKRPLRYVPKLDGASGVLGTIYGINWGVFYPVFLSGEYLNESDPHPAPLQHTARVSDIDLTYNWKCTDRRRLFRLDKAA